MMINYSFCELLIKTGLLTDFNDFFVFASIMRVNQ